MNESRKLGVKRPASTEYPKVDGAGLLFEKKNTIFNTELCMVLTFLPEMLKVTMMLQNYIFPRNIPTLYIIKHPFFILI